MAFSSKDREKSKTKRTKSGSVAAVSAWHAALVAAGFVALYSFLPHKELRFLMPVLPLFNVVAAVGLADAWGDDGDGDDDAKGKKEAKKTKTETKFKRRRSFSSLATPLLLRSLVAAALAATAATTGLSLAAASKNYPGGVALERLHALEEERGGSTFAKKNVHIDVAAAQQGITRFGEREPPSWSYSKDEAVRPSELFDAGFTHLVSELSSVPGFDLAEAVEAFSGARLVVGGGGGGEGKEEVLRPSPGALLRALRARAIPRLKLATEPRIYLHRRRREVE